LFFRIYFTQANQAATGCFPKKHPKNGASLYIVPLRAQSILLPLFWVKNIGLYYKKTIHPIGMELFFHVTCIT
jgi:hypothetical protein